MTPQRTKPENAASAKAPVGLSALRRIGPTHRKTNTSLATDSDQSSPTIRRTNAGLLPTDDGEGIVHRMTAEDERTHQRNSAKDSLMKQKRPGMIRVLVVPWPTPCWFGERGHKNGGNRDHHQRYRAQPDDR